MLIRIMRQMAALFLVVLSSCSNVPPLTSQPGHGPSVRQIVNHINCELASIIASNPSTKSNIKPLKFPGLVDSRILEREAFDSKLRSLLPYLQEYHFVTSVLLTLDTSDTEGFFPAFSFIHPFTTSFNRTIGLGGQLSGSQERNITLGYSIDLANVGDGCFPSEIKEPEQGVAGSLGLGDIVADGLTGLDATKRVNVYSSGGPTRPAFDAALSQMILGFTCNPDPCSPPLSDVTLSGNVNFAPGSDPEIPGAISFSGRARGGNSSYIMNLTGSTIELSEKKGSELEFTLSGAMTLEGSADSDIAKAFGYNPTISLVGVVDSSKQIVRGLTNVRGLLTVSAELSVAQKHYNIAGPSGSKAGGGVAFKSSEVKSKPELATGYTTNIAPSSSANPAGASASTTVKSTASSSAGSTQFGSFVNFMITYGVNGGPSWTVSTFKGPGGGSGTNGQLLSATRTNTATLQLEFVAACNDDNNFQRINTFWQSVPKCNGTQQAQAAATGQALNYLAASGRGM
jgi:hypothetical protein